jgi:CRISPR system Cascade subunit CasB
MNEEPNYDPRVTEFCETLAGLDPGERARLRRNAGRTMAESHKVLGLFFRILPNNVPRYQEETYFMAATLFPMAEPGGHGNLGHALRLAREPRGDGETDPGLDRRVEVLLDADPDQLPFRLRQLIQYLDSKEVKLNRPQLLQDLLAWEHPKRYVQENWARAYFA